MDVNLLKEYTREMIVLYVEDDTNVRNETVLVLQRFFKSVDIACDGQEGLSLYKKSCESAFSYDIVITDVQMPILNGVVMSQEIKKIDEEQNIIIISAHDEAQYLHPLLNLGIDQFILKPIDATTMIRAFFKTCRALYDHKMLNSYIETIEDLNAQLQKKNSELEKSLRHIQSKEVKEKYSYQKNREISPKIDSSLELMIREDLPELNEILEELDAKIINLDRKDIKELYLISELIRRYGAILATYNIFKDVSLSISVLASTMNASPLPADEEKVEHIFLMLESFIYTLNQWKEGWGREENIDINFFDASMISDIEMITNLWLNEEASGVEIEFF